MRDRRGDRSGGQASGAGGDSSQRWPTPVPPRAGRGRLPATAGARPAVRRLSIVGLADGRQPISNEDRSVAVVFNGELFDYPELQAAPGRRGHRFRTHCDTEIIPHLWEEHQEGMFERLRGQFALALWDQRRAARRPGPRPLRHLPAVLDATAGRLAAVRLGDQGAAGVRHGRGPAGPARHRSCLHLLRPARAGDLLRGRAAAAARPLPPHPARRRRRAGAGQRAHLTGRSTSPTAARKTAGGTEKAGGRLRGAAAAGGGRGGCGPTCRWCPT